MKEKPEKTWIVTRGHGGERGESKRPPLEREIPGRKPGGHRVLAVDSLPAEKTKKR